MPTPDITADVIFYKIDENERIFPTAPASFSCIFKINNERHGCRLLLESMGPISPGDIKTKMPIKFLSPDLVIPKLKMGNKFYLWDMINIAEGEIKEIF